MCSKVVPSLRHYHCGHVAHFRGSNTLGIDRPDQLNKEDDEFEAYRKRMMLAYRFRPNPLVRIHNTCT